MGPRATRAKPPATGGTETLAEALSGRRVGLVLSAGFFGFYGHAGFLSGLVAGGVHPAAYAGTSAGGLVCAYAAAGMAPQALEALLLGLRRERFWDPDVLRGLADAARVQEAVTQLRDKPSSASSRSLNTPWPRYAL